MTAELNMEEPSSSSSPESVPEIQPLTPATNPLRRPAWRWDRISYLATKVGNKKRNPVATDDKLIVDGRKYLMHYNNMVRTSVHNGSPADVDNSFTALYAQYPAIAMAHKIYTDKTFARYAIEAMVLAKESASAIASELGCHVDVISYYEHLFYDIRDRVDNVLFIMDALLSPALKYGMAGSDHDFLWKGVAYAHGTAALRGLWSLGKVDEDTKAALDDVMKTLMDRSALRAAAIRQPTQHNAHDILEEHTDRAQVNATAKAPALATEKAFAEGALLLGSAIQLSVASSIAHNMGPQEPRAINSIRSLVHDIIDEIPKPIITLGEGTVTVERPKPVEAIPVGPQPSLFDRKPGPVKSSNVIGKSEERVDLKEKKNLILKRIRDKVVS